MTAGDLLAGRRPAWRSSFALALRVHGASFGQQEVVPIRCPTAHFRSPPRPKDGRPARGGWPRDLVDSRAGTSWSHCRCSTTGVESELERNTTNRSTSCRTPVEWPTTAIPPSHAPSLCAPDCGRCTSRSVRHLHPCAGPGHRSDVVTPAPPIPRAAIVACVVPLIRPRRSSSHGVIA